MQATLDTQPQHLFEELDYRENDGIEVSLLWNRDNNNLSVYVSDTKGDATFEIPVTPTKALDAFQHPFAYLVRRLDTAPKTA